MGKPALVCLEWGLGSQDILYFHHLPCGGEGKDSHNWKLVDTWLWNNFIQIKKHMARTSKGVIFIRYNLIRCIINNSSF